jgi:hypothetical protein
MSRPGFNGEPQRLKPRSLPSLNRTSGTRALPGGFCYRRFHFGKAVLEDRGRFRFSWHVCTQLKTGKGTTYSRANGTDFDRWASAPEVSSCGAQRKSEPQRLKPRSLLRLHRHEWNSCPSRWFFWCSSRFGKEVLEKRARRCCLAQRSDQTGKGTT